jgi:hypothetical protein
VKFAIKSLLAPLSAFVVTTAAAGIQTASAGTFDVFLSAPGTQSTIFTNTMTESFSEFSPGRYTSDLVGTVGTYKLNDSAKMQIVANDQYGSNTGNYAAIGAQSSSSTPVTLQLASGNSYFGFSWNAGDVNNQLSFYNGNQIVGQYSTASVLRILNNATVTALNGQIYQSSAYFGQPTTHQNSSEPYAFINFIYTGGTFDKVVFGNSDTTGTGFESDNHTIRLDAPAPNLTFVSVGSAATPEPGSLALIGSLCVTGGALAKRRRSKLGRQTPLISK